MKRTQIYLEERQAARLDDRAAATGTTRSELIREAIEAYLEETDGADATRLAGFRTAVDEAFGSAPYLPPGIEYVEELRATDRRRLDELDSREPG